MNQGIEPRGSMSDFGELCAWLSGESRAEFIEIVQEIGQDNPTGYLSYQRQKPTFPLHGLALDLARL
jgi:hypothetical protein